MRRVSLPLVILLSFAARVSMGGQTLDFSGTWKLDRAASTVVREAGFTGLGPTGAPETLHITHAANGNVVIGSEVNESQSRLYRVGGKSSLPLADGSQVPAGSRIEGSALITEGATTSGALKEVLTLSADRQTLHVTISAPSASGPRTSTMTYKRQTRAEPCESWPTPCRPQDAFNRRRD